MSKKILRLPQVIEKVGLNTTALYGMIKRGEFPLQIRIGKNKNASGWIESEIDEWIDARAAERVTS